MASRPDLVPQDFIEEMSLLQDQVQTLDFSVVQQVLTEELGADWKKHFSSIEEKPLGSASIAQVHRAVLTGGQHVVIKVQRPGIVNTINDDLNVLYFIAELMDKYIPEVRPFNPVGMWEEPIIPKLNADDFVEVAEAPTGFMCIKREVILRMMEHYPELNYMPEGADKQAKKDLYWLFFDCMVEPETKRYLSEDYAFCRRWRDMGGKVWADFQSDLGHLGQYMYRGNLARSIKRRDGLPY